MYLPNTDKLLSIAEEHRTPTYVYDLDKVRQQYQELDQAITWNNKRIHYAVKANWHPQIIETLRLVG